MVQVSQATTKDENVGRSPSPAAGPRPALGRPQELGRPGQGARRGPGGPPHIFRGADGTSMPGLGPLP